MNNNSLHLHVFFVLFAHSIFILHMSATIATTNCAHRYMLYVSKYRQLEFTSRILFGVFPYHKSMDAVCVLHCIALHCVYILSPNIAYSNNPFFAQIRYGIIYVGLTMSIETERYKS